MINIKHMNLQTQMQLKRSQKQDKNITTLNWMTFCKNILLFKIMFKDVQA